MSLKASPLVPALVGSLRGVLGTGLPWESGGGGAIWPATDLWKLSFNGSNQYTEIPYSATWATTAAWSISLWAYKSSERTSTDMWLATSNEDFNAVTWNGIAFINYSTAGSFRILIPSGSAHTFAALDAAAGSVPADQWNHIVVAYTSGACKLYVNGSEVSLSLTVGSIPAALSWGSHAFRLGYQWANYPVGTGRLFCGYVHSVAMYSSQLTAGNVTTLYNGGVFGGALATNRTGLWLSGNDVFTDADGGGTMTKTPSTAAGPKWVARTYTAPGDGGIRVMCVGDSLTYYNDAYRPELKNLRYQNRGKLLEYVGPATTRFGVQPSYFTDLDHAGVSGNTIAQMKARTDPAGSADLAVYLPDVLVVRGGTNDITAGTAPATVRDAMVAYLTALLVQRPSMKIIYLPAPPRGDAESADALTYNGYDIPALVADARCVLADTRGIFTTGASDTSDNIHLLREAFDGEAPIIEAALNALGL